MRRASALLWTVFGLVATLAVIPATLASASADRLATPSSVVRPNLQAAVESACGPDQPMAANCVVSETAAPTAPIPRSVWLYEPDPGALPVVSSRLDEVLDLAVPQVRQRLLDSEVRIHVIPQDWNLTDLPPWTTLRGTRLPDPNPFDSYIETRTYDGLRGLGPPFCVSGPLDIAVAEELLVDLPRGKYNSPGVRNLGKVLVHEVGHAVECGLDGSQGDQLDRAFTAANARYPTGIVGEATSYTVSTRREYLAEGITAWFEAAQHGSYRRAWLRDNDRALYDLLSKMFAEPGPAVTCDGLRATAIVRPGGVPFGGTPGDDVIVGSDEADVINGGGGDDVICGGGGDDTLAGSYGGDRIYGGPGNDWYAGGSGSDILSEILDGLEADGDDTMDGGSGDDLLEGGAGHDVLVDSSGQDHLVGGAGDDDLDTHDAQLGTPDQIDGSEDYDTCQHDQDDQVSGCTPRPATTTTTTVTTTVPVRPGDEPERPATSTPPPTTTPTPKSATTTQPPTSTPARTPTTPDQSP